MNMRKPFALVLFSLVSTVAFGVPKERTALACRAVKIDASPFEEAFSVKEYPTVKVNAIDKSNPMLPAIVEQLEVEIGANSPYKVGEDGVVAIRNRSESGKFKFVIVFKDKSTVTVESFRGAGKLSSSDGQLVADLRCD